MSSDDKRTVPIRPARHAPAQVEIDDRPIATDVERYEPLGSLGEGGMGEIRLAKDTRIARQVAIKVLSPKLRDQAEFRARFLVEARLQGQLEHPAIVPVHDLGTTSTGELFFSMKCVRGVTLRDALKPGEQAGRFSRRRLLSAFSSVCLAVDFAHSHGVVHRDLKPSNVMLGDFGEVYVLDWGIAKLIAAPDQPVERSLELSATDSASTRIGTVLGTPEYMAPERRKSGIADRRTDVYALGKILGEILDVEPADVPPELTTIAATATATDVTERYATARELHDVLERYLDGDRDSELRRVKAEEHARAAETAFARDDAQARSDAGREIGRALGLDPANARAMRTLMRLLTEVPAQLPPAARTQIERVWQERRTRTLRYATLLTASVALYIPFILWMGVRDWWLFGTWVALTGGAIAGQLLASRNERTLPFLLAFVCAVGELGVLTTSMGLTGFVPLAFAVVAIAWRVTVKRTLHGVLILAALITAVCTPFMLPVFGLMSPTYVVQDDALVVLPHMHHFTGAATALSLLLSVVGALIGAVLFGRLYADEIGRAEERLTFHAWQLQQLLPPES